ncbi:MULTISPECIES: PhoX family protein [unclassified Streptomyces]|uniref:PhoX family protein n=1 Tax=unclassified Streptomyces TaxID=2593676 RepID=UPI0022B722CF|nr:MULTISPECIES: PhoX family phosphatase [unclassified Streptomyces]MCZ7413819.1 PhoX family phosphatase [Streptomyces sp. WMMC897]MCZ7430815.1 PhoX family phosphatase [Streptomyces sp. WMMC1477]
MNSPQGAESAEAGVSRRDVLAGGAALAAAFVAASASGAAALTSAPGTTGAAGRPGAGAPLGFTPVPVSEADAITVPDAYTAEVLAPWGRPVRPGGPAWREDGGNPAAEQAVQVGSHHHGVRFLPLAKGGRGARHGMLMISHEAVDRALLGGDTAKALAAQGVTAVEVRDTGGGWRVVDSARNRRVTGTTQVAFSGPFDPGTGPHLGVLACGGDGVTPWGTYLACEENANAHFGTDERGWRPTETQRRYGLSHSGYGDPWHREEPRFDLAADADGVPEAQRFGWVIEIDPRDPDSTPVKRTALGRYPHAGAAVTESGGRVVVYSADAEDGEYLYKFTGSADWRTQRTAGENPLDHGTLHVARLDADGTGTWLPLRHGVHPLTERLGWRDQGDVLLRARQAADALGATPLERPERVTVNPRNGDVYAALAGGPGGLCCEAGHAGDTRRAAPHGRILRWREDGGDPAATTFHWEEFVSDPLSGSDEAAAFAAPKGVWFDADGLLWISTGIPGRDLNQEGTEHAVAGNNALLAADPKSGEIRRFLTGPRGAEITGVCATPDGRTLFVNVQHPGQRTARWGAPDVDSPGAVSTWPDGRPGGRARSATVAIRRRDGGPIGT